MTDSVLCKGFVGGYNISMFAMNVCITLYCVVGASLAIKNKVVNSKFYNKLCYKKVVTDPAVEPTVEPEVVLKQVI